MCRRFVLMVGIYATCSVLFPWCYRFLYPSHRVDPLPPTHPQNPEHLLVFAAGNLGDDMSGCSIASPAVSKNGLAVGSSMSGETRLSPDDLDSVSDFSSKGPTSDGRIKPDVLAPGHFVSSW